MPSREKSARAGMSGGRDSGHEARVSRRAQEGKWKLRRNSGKRRSAIDLGAPVIRARLPFLLLLALPLAACGKEVSPAPQAEPQSKTAPEAKPAPTAELAPTAAPALAPPASAVASTASVVAPAASVAASAAASEQKASTSVNAPLALPKASHGVLPAGAADKLIPSGGAAIVRLLDAGAEPRADL